MGDGGNSQYLQLPLGRSAMSTTIIMYAVFLILFVMMCLAILTVRARGNRIDD